MIILIFGGTGELMSEIAIGLITEKHQVIVIGRDKTKFDKKFKSVDFENVEFIFFEIIKGNIDELFEKIYNKYDHIDMLINGAGVNSSTPFLKITEQEMHHIFHINYYFVVQCCQKYIQKTLEQNRRGRILNIGSVSAIHPLSKVFIYSSSKAALHNFSKNIAREYGEQFNINILVPGFFPAEQNKKILTEERKQEIIKQTPALRFGNPNDLVGIVSLLTSDKSIFINGAELVVDGGFLTTKL